jgi:rubredoxin
MIKQTICLILIDMKYLCVNCNYMYDEALGDDMEGIAP